MLIRDAEAPAVIPAAVVPPASTSASSTSAAAGAVVRDKLLFRPASWFEPLDLGSMFVRAAPLEVELGSGDGSFLVAWAAKHPERNYLGVERLLGRIRKLDRKAQRAGLTNVRVLRIEAGYCLEYLLPPGGVEAVHLYFPDPWPKRRHHKNRLVHERFVLVTHRALQPGGCIHLRTDSEDYFSEMTRVFDASPAFRRGPTPDDLASTVTDFERGFQARGIATLRASYVAQPGEFPLPPLPGS